MLSLLAVLCPPLAVLVVSRPSQAALNVGLTALLYLPGLIHALAVVDRYQVDRRNEALLKAVSHHYA
ncbi:MAG TPA: YqaE/Pmp3 family membrane protein [Fimbriiglobus sp.]|nr:YqaE/Pmp3 family membrane protein [Fimbriiglobus sp.]